MDRVSCASPARQSRQPPPDRLSTAAVALDVPDWLAIDAVGACLKPTAPRPDRPSPFESDRQTILAAAIVADLRGGEYDGTGSDLQPPAAPFITSKPRRGQTTNHYMNRAARGYDPGRWARLGGHDSGIGVKDGRTRSDGGNGAIHRRIPCHRPRNPGGTVSEAPLASDLSRRRLAAGAAGAGPDHEPGLRALPR